MDKVFPAIRQKFPGSYRENIVLQQENAELHVAVNEPEILIAGSEQFWNIVLRSQSANSPDFNVLYLGFFIALQNPLYKEPCLNIQDLVTAVEKSFDN